MIEQPLNYLSILGGGSEPVGSIPALDNNWMSCANQVVMLDESDDEVPDLEDLSVNDNEEQHRPMFVHSPYGLNTSARDYLSRLVEIYETNGISPINSSSNEYNVAVSVEELLPSIHQIYVDGPSSGRSRIVPVGSSVAAEYVDRIRIRYLRDARFGFMFIF